MISSFWNLCRACPSMPVEKLHSEYRSTFQWHEYVGSHSDSVTQPPVVRQPSHSHQDQLSILAGRPEDPPFPRRKKHPELANRCSHGWLTKSSTTHEANLCPESRFTNISGSGGGGGGGGGGLGVGGGGGGGGGPRKSLSMGTIRSSGNIAATHTTKLSLMPEYKRGAVDETEPRTMTSAAPEGMSTFQENKVSVGGGGGELSSFVPSQTTETKFHIGRESEGTQESKPEDFRRKEYKSEYKKRFRPFSQYEYVDGKFFKKKGEIENPWYNEVIELRKKAGEYKFRGWGTELGPQNIAQVYHQHIWDQVSRRTSLAALALITTTPKSISKEEKDKENAKKSYPGRATHARPHTATPKHPISDLEKSKHHKDTDAVQPSKKKLLEENKIQNKSTSRVKELKTTTPRPPTYKPTFENKTNKLLREARSHSAGPAGRSPRKAIRQQSAASSISEKDTSVGGGWKIHLDSTQVDNATNKPAQRHPRPTTLATSPRPKASSGKGDRDPNSKLAKQQQFDKNSADPYLGYNEPVVKSPPEPTRVKSPEQVILRSPDPVNWTVPLDTTKSFTVTQNIREAPPSPRFRAGEKLHGEIRNIHHPQSTHHSSAGSTIASSPISSFSTRSAPVPLSTNSSGQPGSTTVTATTTTAPISAKSSTAPSGVTASSASASTTSAPATTTSSSTSSSSSFATPSQVAQSALAKPHSQPPTSGASSQQQSSGGLATTTSSSTKTSTPGSHIGVGGGGGGGKPEVSGTGSGSISTTSASATTGAGTVTSTKLLSQSSKLGGEAPPPKSSSTHQAINGFDDKTAHSKSLHTKDKPSVSSQPAGKSVPSQPRMGVGATMRSKENAKGTHPSSVTPAPAITTASSVVTIASTTTSSAPSHDKTKPTFTGGSPALHTSSSSVHSSVSGGKPKPTTGPTLRCLEDPTFMFDPPKTAGSLSSKLPETSKSSSMTSSRLPDRPPSASVMSSATTRISDVPKTTSSKPMMDASITKSTMGGAAIGGTTASSKIPEPAKIPSSMTSSIMGTKITNDIPKTTSSAFSSKLSDPIKPMMSSTPPSKPYDPMKASMSSNIPSKIPDPFIKSSPVIPSKLPDPTKSPASSFQSKLSDPGKSPASNIPSKLPDPSKSPASNIPSKFSDTGKSPATSNIQSKLPEPIKSTPVSIPSKVPEPIQLLGYSGSSNGSSISSKMPEPMKPIIPSKLPDPIRPAPISSIPSKLPEPPKSSSLTSSTTKIPESLKSSPMTASMSSKIPEPSTKPVATISGKVPDAPMYPSPSIHTSGIRPPSAGSSAGKSSFRVLEAPPSPPLIPDPKKKEVFVPPPPVAAPKRTVGGISHVSDTPPPAKGSGYRVLEAPDDPAEPTVSVISPSSGRSRASDVLEKARTRFDKFWGGKSKDEEK